MTTDHCCPRFVMSGLNSISINQAGRRAETTHSSSEIFGDPIAPPFPRKTIFCRPHLWLPGVSKRQKPQHLVEAGKAKIENPKSIMAVSYYVLYDPQKLKPSLLTKPCHQAQTDRISP